MGVIQPARRPRKHLAAVSLTIVTLAVLAAALVFTALYGVATAPGAVPAAEAVGCLASVGAFATVLLLFIIVLLFPDGHLPSPRWAPVLWATAVVFIDWGTQQFQAGTVTGGFTNALQAGHATYPNPVGFLPRHGWYSNLLTVIFALSVVTAIGVVASVFARRRGASPERRLAASDSQDLSSVWVAMTTKTDERSSARAGRGQRGGVFVARLVR